MKDLLDNPNFRYCVQFIRNGGDRLRAVRLVIDTTNIEIKEAVKYVDSLSTTKTLQQQRKETKQHMEQHAADIYENNTSVE